MKSPNVIFTFKDRKNSPELSYNGEFFILKDKQFCNIPIILKEINEEKYEIEENDFISNGFIDAKTNPKLINSLKKYKATYNLNYESYNFISSMQNESLYITEKDIKIKICNDIFFVTVKENEMNKDIDVTYKFKIENNSLFVEDGESFIDVENIDLLNDLKGIKEIDTIFNNHYSSLIDQHIELYSEDEFE